MTLISSLCDLTEVQEAESGSPHSSSLCGDLKALCGSSSPTLGWPILSLGVGWWAGSGGSGEVGGRGSDGHSAVIGGGDAALLTIPSPPRASGSRDSTRMIGRSIKVELKGASELGVPRWR